MSLTISSAPARSVGLRAIYVDIHNPTVHRLYAEALADGKPRLLDYGVSDDEAFAVGLTCGGTIHLYLEPLDW